MFRIRKQQMDVFKKRMSEDFESRIYLHLRNTYPDVRLMREEDVRASIQTGVQRAAGYGITAEYDVARFVDLMYILSPDFDSNPGTDWVRDVLLDNQMQPNEKMDMIYEKA